MSSFIVSESHTCAPVPRLLNFKCHFSFKIYLSHQFSVFSQAPIYLSIWRRHLKIFWWFLSFNIVFILSLYYRCARADAERIRKLVCLFGTGDIKPFSDLFSENFLNEFRTHFKRKIYFIFVVYSNVVVFVNNILCFQHTF